MFEYTGGYVAIDWHDADAMLLIYPAAVPAASLTSQPSAMHHYDCELPANEVQSDDKRFPLTGSLT